MGKSSTVLPEARLPKLTATLDERQTAKQRADSSYRQRLVDKGLCVRCGRRPRKEDAQRCGICTAKAKDAAWQRRQRVEAKAHGPVPAMTGWNFETDELITDHMTMARKIARRVASTRVTSADQVDDMVGDAMLGLVVAGRTFDESYGVPFGAWAAKQCKGAIFDGMRRWSKTGKSKPVFVSLGDADEA